MLRILPLLVLLVAPSTLLAEGVPPVALSAGHQKMCRVGVGDAMPELSLANAKGDATKLASLYGKQATVVALVGEEGWMAKQLLADLSGDVAQLYGTRGVATVLVNVGDNEQEELRLGFATTTLADPSGKQFAKLGSGRVPRVYVLDAKGQIVWFDIEYSRSTRRELKQTLAAVVGE